MQTTEKAKKEKADSDRPAHTGAIHPTMQAFPT